MNNYQKYKLIILASIGFIFLIIYYNNSGNGRYQFHPVKYLKILDTQKGRLYNTSGKRYEDITEFRKREKK
jgi:hypothetical protein